MVSEALGEDEHSHPQRTAWHMESFGGGWKAKLGARGWRDTGSRTLAASPATLGAADQKKHGSQGTDGQKLMHSSSPRVGSGPMVA